MENPRQFVEDELCPDCPHARCVDNAQLFKLLDYLALMDAGCPVGRHELRDDEWRALGAVKKERELVISESVRDGNGTGE